MDVLTLGCSYESSTVRGQRCLLMAQCLFCSVFLFFCCALLLCFICFIANNLERHTQRRGGRAEGNFYFIFSFPFLFSSSSYPVVAVRDVHTLLPFLSPLCRCLRLCRLRFSTLFCFFILYLYFTQQRYSVSLAFMPTRTLIPPSSIRV